MEIELHSINNGNEGTAVAGEETESSKGFTGLDELLEQELKEDDSVGCLRVGDGSGDGSELGLNYVVTNPPDATFYSAKEDADTDNILDKELADALSNNEDTSSGDHNLVHEETTRVQVPVMSSVVVGDIVTEEVIGVTEEVIDGGAGEVEDNTRFDDVRYQEESAEFAYNEEENGEGLENEYENAELAETQDLCEEIAESEENTELADTQDACKEIEESEENAEFVETQETCEEIVANVEGDEQTESQEEETVEDQCENEEYIENEDENEEYDIVDSLENEEKISEDVQNEGESLEPVEEEEEYCDCPEDEAESERILDVAECEMNEVDTEENVMETDFGEEEQNSEEVTLPSENPNGSVMISGVTKTNVGSEVQVSDEVSLPSEIPPDDPKEIVTETVNAIEEQNTSMEKSPQPSGDNVIYLMVQTKETSNKRNGDLGDNISNGTTVATEVPCTENCTKTPSTRTDKQPAGKAVLTISEPKTIKGINKSIIIKTIKTKIVKNSTSAVTSQAGTTTTTLCVSNELTNTKDNQQSEESKPKETKDDNSEKQNEKSEKKSDKGKVIVSPAIKTKILKSRRSPRKQQEKRVMNTKRVPAAKKDSQEKKTNGIQKKRVKYSVMTDKRRGDVAASSSKGDEKKEKKIQFMAVKRKLEEMFQVSQEEDELMIDEIKKMKMETLDVLTKINDEIEKIKSVFLERQ